MKNIGIWLDSKKAYIVRVSDNNDSMEKVDSQIDFYNRTSTGGSRVKWGGTQDITHEQSFLEKEKHQFKKYFKTIADTISDVDSLALFGPADINEKLRKELMDNYPSIGKRIVAVKKADSMTENETRALILDFFNNR
ncbi:hypothetical protein PP182_09985 [Maribacter sp. PR1]|uniref:Host attachment protein n=1 Tax=Maribacter cobaltidurans TaxID=1178778 RepID=A0ABU7IUV2_9FLAO|nr:MULTISPECIES: hypothetical protein [Maribacter]MDC6389010.1 hypothetical protein [Maribacter sp. PR1]MEE1976398.1 hypothetical protein [Maribacter cobaltidurans]